jgi:hypothetical protein
MATALLVVLVVVLQEVVLLAQELLDKETLVVAVERSVVAVAELEALVHQ